MSISTRFKDFQSATAAYGKENLGELLYALAENTKQLSGCEQIRIYLEDLTRGTLTCVHATGPLGKELVETTFPIVSQKVSVSNVFATQTPEDFKLSGVTRTSPDYECATRFRFRSSYHHADRQSGEIDRGPLYRSGPPRRSSGQPRKNRALAELAGYCGRPS